MTSIAVRTILVASPLPRAVAFGHAARAGGTVGSTGGAGSTGGVGGAGEGIERGGLPVGPASFVASYGFARLSLAMADQDASTNSRTLASICR